MPCCARVSAPLAGQQDRGHAYVQTTDLHHFREVLVRNFAEVVAACWIFVLFHSSVTSHQHRTPYCGPAQCTVHCRADAKRCLGFDWSSGSETLVLVLHAVLFEDTLPLEPLSLTAATQCVHALIAQTLLGTQASPI